MYASKLQSENDKPNSEDKPLNGKSFIRYTTLSLFFFSLSFSVYDPIGNGYA